LLGMAEAYRYQGKKTEAVDYYRKYLDRSPSGAKAVAAKRYIDEVAPSSSHEPSAPVKEQPPEQKPEPKPEAPPPEPKPEPKPEAPPPPPPDRLPDKPQPIPEAPPPSGAPN